jgi:hypothetical protein
MPKKLSEAELRSERRVLQRQLQEMRMDGAGGGAKGEVREWQGLSGT